MIRHALSGLALAASLALPAFATDMTDAERDAFRAEVRAYLLENPEVLMEAIAVLEKRQATQAAADEVTLIKVNAEEIFNDGYSWIGGNPDGDITMVEFMDYRCGYCRKAHEEVKSLIEADGNIRFIVKEFPILGEDSEMSARFAIATKEIEGDDAYAAVYEDLITMRGNATPKNLAKIADKRGFNTDAILTAMTSDSVTEVINRNRSLANRLSISGTPTFVLDEKMLRGYVPLAGMQQIVGEVRAN